MLLVPRMKSHFGRLFRKCNGEERYQCKSSFQVIYNCVQIYGTLQIALTDLRFSCFIMSLSVMNRWGSGCVDD